jgi:hypothetical protein
VYTIKAHGGMEIQLHSFITPTLVGWEWLKSHPVRISPGKSHRTRGCVVPIAGLGRLRGGVQYPAPYGNRTVTDRFWNQIYYFTHTREYCKTFCRTMYICLQCTFLSLWTRESYWQEKYTSCYYKVMAFVAKPRTTKIDGRTLARAYFASDVGSTRCIKLSSSINMVQLNFV